ncbi:MAG: DUF3261 domain-containing protein [Sandaracinaceae bacterium]|nr:DUF3261 domain-containing protein [Sandaracinaceae bacterium]
MTRVLLALALASCGGAHGPPPEAGPPPEYPGSLADVGTLVSPPALGDAFALEQRVRTEYPDGAQEFRAVLQRVGDRMVLIGFGPHGGRGFALTQTGEAIEFESQMPEELPFPPEFMFHDIQRVWFRGLRGPLPDGEHREVVDGEEIVERWEGDRLQERTFRRLDGEPAGVLRATYEGGLGAGDPPAVVRWENPWFGYRLILTTLSHQAIDPE